MSIGEHVELQFSPGICSGMRLLDHGVVNVFSVLRNVTVLPRGRINTHSSQQWKRVPLLHTAFIF